MSPVAIHSLTGGLHGGPNGKEVGLMTTRKTVYRSAESGEFVTKKYADDHPRTTEKERVYVPAPKTKD
jgi:hypothetical protein